MRRETRRAETPRRRRMMDSNSSTELFCGQFDASIQELALCLLEFFENMFLLATCLDSSPDAKKWTGWLDYLGDNGLGFKPLEGGVLLMPASLRRVIQDRNTFFGFDEVYLLQSEPDEWPRMSECYTSDNVSFAEEIPAGLREVFRRADLAAFFADGCGLNVATRSSLLFKSIVCCFSRSVSASG